METAAHRLEAYLGEAKKIVRSTLDIDFDEQIWQLPWNRIHKKNSKKLNWKGISSGLSDFGKAIVANESLVNGGTGRLASKAFIMILKRLQNLLGERPIGSLCRKDFDNLVKSLVREGNPYKPLTISSYGSIFQDVVKVCNVRKLVDVRIEWKNPFPWVESSEKDHLISAEIFKAFGEIRTAVLEVDDNDRDRLLVHAITVLICTGLRIGELLTLPLDCLHEAIGEDDEGRICSGIWLGYAPEKHGLNESTFPRWIPTPLVPLVKDAIQEIAKITSQARDNARALINGRVNVDIDLDSSYNLIEVSELLGLNYYSILHIMKNVKNFKKFEIKFNGVWPKYSGPKSHYKKIISGKDVVQYIRDNSIVEPVMLRPFRLNIDDSLFVVPKNFFHGKSANVNGTANPVTANQISGGIRSFGNVKSLFERYGKLDGKTGKPISFATHDPRHTLTTWQIKHGFDAIEVASYFGRNVEKPEKSNSFYDHLTHEERMLLVDRALEAGRLRGGLADAIAKIKDPVKKKAVRHQLAANVGYSQLGICSHPEGGAPPTMPEACSSCPGLIVITGSKVHQMRALEIQEEINQRIKVYEEQVSEGVFMAGKWLELEYLRQKNHQRVVEALFCDENCDENEEPILVQMGKPKK